METAVEKFLGIFQVFIDLCKVDNWPNDDTAVEHIREALEFSQYIENCIDKLQKNYVLNDFMSALKERQNTSIMKYCLPAASKFMLKKILNSSANVDLVDAGIHMFVDIFSQEKLEVCLSEIMLEVASKDTLLKNMQQCLSKSDLADFKTQLFLTKLCCEENPSGIINKMLNENCTQDVVDMLAGCLLNNNSKYRVGVEVIAKGFVDVMMSSQNVINPRFWKQIFFIEEEKFLQMCQNYTEIFQLISKSLIDCGKMIEKNFSVQNFYVNLTYSEFSWNIKKICSDGGLRIKFLELLSQNNVNMAFWERETQAIS